MDHSLPPELVADSHDVYNWHDTPRDPATLHALASHPEPSVRYQIALHPDTGAETLRQLAADAVPWVRESTAFNPHTPADLLAAHLASGKPALWFALAHNPTLSEAQQLELVALGDAPLQLVVANQTNATRVWQAILDDGKARACDWYTDLALALDPKTKAGKFTRLLTAANMPLCLQKAAARHPNCPERLWPSLLHHLPEQLKLNPHFALRLLENPGGLQPEPPLAWKCAQWLTAANGPAMMMSALSRDTEQKDRLKAFGAPTLSIAEIQPRLALLPCHTLLRIAARPDLTTFLFHQLVQAERPGVRATLGVNPACPPELRTALLNDPESSVRAAVLNQYPHLADATTTSKPLPVAKRVAMAKKLTQPELLAELAQDEALEVRLAVAENYHTDGNALARLSQDGDLGLRLCVAEHSEVLPATLEQLVQGAEPEIRACVIHNHRRLKKRDLEGWLATFVEDESPLVRQAVATNCHSARLLLRLARDPDESVQLTVLGKTKDLPTLQALTESQFDDVHQALVRAIRTPELYAALYPYLRLETRREIVRERHLFEHQDGVALLRPEWQHALLQDGDPALLGPLLPAFSDAQVLAQLIATWRQLGQLDPGVSSKAVATSKLVQQQRIWAGIDDDTIRDALLANTALAPEVMLSCLAANTEPQKWLLLQSLARRSRHHLVSDPLYSQVELQLIGESSRELRRLAARHCITAPAILALSSDLDDEIQLVLAKAMGNEPEQSQERAPLLNDPRYLEAKARIGANPQPQIRQIIDDSWALPFRSAEAQQRQQLESALAELATLRRSFELDPFVVHPMPSLRARAAAHPCASLWHWLQLAQDPSTEVREAVAHALQQEPRLPAALLAKLQPKDEAEMNQQLQALALCEPDGAVLLARYRTVPPTLESIPVDCAEVMVAVLANPALGGLLLDELLYLSQEPVQLAVARSEAVIRRLCTTHIKLLAKLEQAAYPAVRLALCRNPQMAISRLAPLCRDSCTQVQLQAIARCDDPAALRAVLEQNHLEAVIAAAQRLIALDRLGPRSRTSLREHSNPQISAWAQAQLAQGWHPE
jgi:hypothetical protein